MALLNPSHPDYVLNLNLDEDIQVLAQVFFDQFIEAIDYQNNQFNVFTQAPIQEIHPYLHFRNQMIDKPKGYIIGTFPPATHLRNSILWRDIPIGDRHLFINGNCIKPKPQLSFFHGNDLKLWQFLQIQDLTVENILNFLNEKDWVYSDIIYSCSRNDINDSSDSNLRDIVINLNIVEEIINRKDRPYIWFTSSSVFNSAGISLNNNGLIDITENQPYNLFIHALQIRQKHIEIYYNNEWIDVSLENNHILSQIKNRYHHNIKIDGNEIIIYTGPSPSGSAARGLGKNELYRQWHLLNNVNTPTNRYREFIYSQFINFII